jgi:hypothetical protein
MTEEQIQEQINEIEQIYADFRNKLTFLKREQDDIVTAFLKDLENNKLQEIRNLIASQ